LPVRLARNCTDLKSKTPRTEISAFSGRDSLKLETPSGPNYVKLGLKSAGRD
jgi:hypothetical protein